MIVHVVFALAFKITLAAFTRVCSCGKAISVSLHDIDAGALWLIAHGIRAPRASIVVKSSQVDSSGTSTANVVNIDIE